MRIISIIWIHTTQHKDKQLYKWLKRAFIDIKKNYGCGIQIPKKLIPKVYLKKYGIYNLYKYDLPKSWRLLYSLKGNNVVIVSIILE